MGSDGGEHEPDRNGCGVVSSGNATAATPRAKPPSKLATIWVDRASTMAMIGRPTKESTMGALIVISRCHVDREGPRTGTGPRMGTQVTWTWSILRTVEAVQ